MFINYSDRLAYACKWSLVLSLPVSSEKQQINLETSDELKALKGSYNIPEAHTKILQEQLLVHSKQF